MADIGNPNGDTEAITDVQFLQWIEDLDPRNPNGDTEAITDVEFLQWIEDLDPRNPQPSRSPAKQIVPSSSESDGDSFFSDSSTDPDGVHSPLPHHLRFRGPPPQAIQQKKVPTSVPTPKTHIPELLNSNEFILRL